MLRVPDDGPPADEPGADDLGPGDHAAAHVARDYGARADDAPMTTPTTRPTTRPSVPAVKAVQRTFQVDRYMPKTAAQARVVARLDDDGVLRYREDRALWGANNWQFVTVRVPADASKAQVMAVINAKTSSRVGDVHTGSRLRSITRGRSVTIAWELGKGARPTSAWGANKSVNQMFFARS